MSMSRATRRQLEADLERTRQQRDDAFETIRSHDAASAIAPLEFLEEKTAAPSRYPDEVRHAVIAVAIRLEERADKKTLPNGASLCVVESLYERAAALRDLLGYEAEADQEHAEELLTEILGSR